MADEIVAKVQKLLKLAESSNEHEASLAMAKAQELMLRHAIDEEMLIRAGEPERQEAIVHRFHEVPSRQTGVKARRTLLNLTAAANRCKVIRYGPQSSTKFEITGFESDVAFVVNLYESLLRQMSQALREDGATSTTAKNNFMWGWTERVTTRLMEAMRASMKQLQTEYEDFLPAVRSRAQEVEAALVRRHPRLVQSSFGKPGAYDATARARGRAAGDRADLAGARAALS